MSDVLPIQSDFDKIKVAYGIFQTVLNGAVPHEVFNEKKLTFSQDGKRLYEFTSNGKLLAEAVLGIDFPRIVDKVELVHYTPIHGLKGIVAKEALYLQPVARNLPDDEFTAFAVNHELDGYFTQGKTGKQVYEELSNDLFYLSLTQTNHTKEEVMWRDFAGGGTGVRLRLCITPMAGSELRRVGYQSGTPTAFKRINEELRRQLQLFYVPWGVSRICAFYILNKFYDEQEVRLLIKRHPDGQDLTTLNGSTRVWPVELGTASGPTSDLRCGIQLIGVEVGPRCSIETVQSVLDGSRYAGVSVR